MAQHTKRVLLNLGEDLFEGRRVEPEMEVLPNVDEIDHPIFIEEQRRRMRHPPFNRLGILLQDPQVPDELTFWVGEKQDALGEPKLINKDSSALIHLSVRHDPNDLQTGGRLKNISQLHEPRLGEGSPVDAAFEGQQDSMPQQILAGEATPLEIHEFKLGKALPDRETRIDIGTHEVLGAARTDLGGGHHHVQPEQPEHQ